MKAAIYNPYLDTLGGGERYTVGVIKVLLALGYSVEIEWKDEKILKKLEDRFGSSLKNTSVVNDIKRGDGYDICFWVSDGSIPALKARKNILHFQVPFHRIGGNSLINKMKLIRVDHIVCNSKFTKDFIDYEFGVDSLVIYPPVDIDLFKPKRKEKEILYVGRFSSLLQSKGQSILIEGFKKLYDSGYKDWSLILAGGVEVGSEENLEKLESTIEKYPIKIIKSPKLKEIKELYGKSRFFWSAAGFGVNVQDNPEKLEHFGLTLVESMSSGCCPIVFNAGGYKEVVKNGENGYLWEGVDELVSITSELIMDNKKLNEVSKSAISSSKQYSYENFKEKLSSLF